MEELQKKVSTRTSETSNLVILILRIRASESDFYYIMNNTKCYLGKQTAILFRFSYVQKKKTLQANGSRPILIFRLIISCAADRERIYAEAFAILISFGQFSLTDSVIR